MICKKCGCTIPEGEERVINEGTDRVYHVCELCHDSMWDRDEIIKCFSCGAWYDNDVLQNIGMIGGDSFVPCPACGNDIVDGMDLFDRAKEDDNLSKFQKLCTLLIVSDGNPSCKDVMSIGYSFEHFLRLCSGEISREKLVENARKRLAESGIYCN